MQIHPQSENGNQKGERGDKMIRILQSVSNMDRAGLETMLMNYYRHIDRTKVQFDFIVNKPKPGNYDEEIKHMGGRIFLSPGLSPLRYPKYLRFVKEIVEKDDRIKIVHAHNEAMGFYALSGAKKAGVKVRIAHAHNTQIIRDYKWPLKMVCKRLLPLAATDLWSCGRDAGIYYFGKKRWEERGVIIRNAIETEKFAFNTAVRDEMRKKYDLKGKKVLGHVGRFNLQKNHDRLLDIFAAYQKRNPESMLVLVGEGELESEVREKTEKLGLANKVIFAGLQKNVNEWYQMMDVFLLPSLFEGLPVVGVEAQAAGLPCIFSDRVTDEIALSDQVMRLSLDAENEKWAEAIEYLIKNKKDRKQGAGLVRKAGYDIATEAERLQNLYLSMSER